jgi:two-component system chemotaxis response regulator CheY
MSAPEDSLPPNRKSVRVLVADDDHIMRELIASLAEREGFTVAGRARDGDEAVRLFQETQPDVVLLDVEMPGKSGLEVMDALSSTADMAKIVMVSATPSADAVRRAVEKGATHFVVKPFSAKKLTEAIALSLARQAAGNP